jgi:hypothetical protein
MNREQDATIATMDESRQDRDDLLGLSLFHYLMSGFSVLTAITACAYVAVATYLPSPGTPAGFQAPAEGLTGIYIALRAVLIAGAAALAVAMLAAGRCISRRRRYRFCFCVACAECLLIGFGTLLGVITIVVLRRPSVRRLFGVEADSCVAERQ